MRGGVTIQGTNWTVPVHHGEPFLGYPKWKVVNGKFENDTQSFYRITDDDQKFCWICRDFVSCEQFFWLTGETFWAEKIPYGRAAYCMRCVPERKVRFRRGEWC